MKYWQMIGWLLIYGAIYLLSCIIAAILVIVPYVFQLFMTKSPIPPEQYALENMTLILVISGVLTVVFCGLVLLLRRRNPLKHLEFKRISLRDSAVLILGGIGFSLLITGIMTLLQVDKIMSDPLTDQVYEMMSANTSMFLLAIAFAAPLYEEILFRGLILKELKDTVKMWAAIFVQALLFGLFHANLLQFSYTFPAGIFLGIIAYKYRSLWAPILIHLAWNTTSSVLALALPRTIKTEYFTLSLGIGFLLLTGVALYTFKTKPARGACLEGQCVD